MSKKRKIEEPSFWPGYVDALVNVVLNILFLVGLLAVGLVSLNFDSLGKNKELRLALALESIRHDTLLLASLGTVESAVQAMLPEARKREEELQARKMPEPPPPPAKPRVDRQKVIQIGRVANAQTRSRETELLQAAGTLPARFWTTHQEKKLPAPGELTEIRTGLQDPRGRVVLFATYPQDLPDYKEAIFLGMQRLQLRLVQEGVAASRIRLLMKPAPAEHHIPGDLIFVWVENSSPS